MALARGAAIVPVPMGTQAVGRIAHARTRHDTEPVRVAFLGAGAWLENCCPPAATHALSPRWVPAGGAFDIDKPLAVLDDFQPHVTVVFDPLGMPAESLRELPGLTLGVLVGCAPAGEAVPALGCLDRIVSFRPALTGAPIADGRVWRAIPPPVSDALFAEVRPLHDRPRVMAVGRSTAHRERMLMLAKHHHDLMQVIHGVSGASLIELLGEHDVGVYIAPEAGGGFGQQVGMHLAAGQLLLAETLVPAHGLERNIDYLHIDSAEELMWVLDRLGRFPEMHQRIRLRGRLKAEQYRASRVFGRVVHDLLADIAAFGSDHARA